MTATPGSTSCFPPWNLPEHLFKCRVLDGNSDNGLPLIQCNAAHTRRSARIQQGSRPNFKREARCANLCALLCPTGPHPSLISSSEPFLTPSPSTVVPSAC